MRFDWTPQQKALVREVRQWIKENITPEVLQRLEEEGEEWGWGPTYRALRRKIYERGWIGIAVPKEYGGQGGSRIDQYLVEEEFARAGVNIEVVGSGVPAILAAGTEEQKRYFIPRLLTGEFVFALGFTEPQAGADLAGIQCRAVRDGDFYIINGQKMYTSAAHYATHIYLMVRTDPTAERHRGLSILIVPMDTPGITVRPLWTIQNTPRAPRGTTYGAPRTNEVFFDNVRVPVSCRLGPENQGWYIAAGGLNLDRVGAWRYLISVKRDEDIVNWIKAHREDGHPVARAAAQDPAIRDRIAELWIEAQVCRLMTLRSMALVERGGTFTYEGSAEKVWAPEHGVRSTETIAQVLGPYAQLMNGSPLNIERGIFAHNLLGAFQSGINHGSVQVMRDQVARRGLGLPRG